MGGFFLKKKKVQGDARQSKASAEHAASHEVGKVGPVSISSSGGVATDHPDRAEGSWNQTIGSGKEMLGNLVGADGLKQEGIRQNQQGKGQEAEGQVSDYGHGVGKFFFFGGGGVESFKEFPWKNELNTCNFRRADSLIDDEIIMIGDDSGSGQGSSG